MSVGIFVTARGHFEGGAGGVQTCTHEYVDVIKAAGIDLKLCLLGADQDFDPIAAAAELVPVFSACPARCH